LTNGFTTWDDPQYILDNPLIRSLSPGNIAAIFTTREFAGNYHPLTLLCYALEYSLFGASPFGYHLVSLLLHLGIVFIIFQLIRRLTGSPLTAFGVSLMFGVHPVHLEPVAWLADQKDLLYTLFYTGAVLGYLRSRETGEVKIFILTTVPLFVFSALSKGLAVTLPVTLLLVEYYCEGTITGKRLGRIIPLFGISLLFGALAIHAQSAAGAIVDVPVDTPVEKMLYASTGFVTYIMKLLVPYGLSPYYPYPQEVPGHAWGLLILAAGIPVAAFAYRKKSPVVFFGVAFFTVTVLPVLQLLQVGNAMMADRYAYLPSIGILLIIVRRMERAADTLAVKHPAARVFAGVTGGIYVLALAAMTFSLGGIWHDGVTMWDRVVKESPGHPKAYFNRGYARYTLGDYPGAIADYDTTLSIFPDYPYVRFNRGISLFRLGDRQRALADFNDAVEKYPDEPLVFHWRANLYASISEYDLAAADYTRVLDSQPDDFVVLMRRALTFVSAGRYPQALADYTTAIALRPSDVSLYFNRGNVLSAMGRYEDAVEAYSTVLRTNPADRDALYGRGIALHLAGHDPDACDDLRRASILGSEPARKALVEICGK
ncbi:MAG TPA: tetratricopeptide repeat protein, partial [Bacteroidota bacterium]|nr:tetratricopeptide repeat protein [Bacteroidota bacterium]